LRPSVDTINRAVTTAEKQDDPLLHARALQSSGEIEQARGYYGPAQELLEAALEKFKTHEDVQGQATCLHALGVISHLHDPNAPIRYFEEAYKMFGMTNDRHGQAEFLLSWSMHLYGEEEELRCQEASAIVNDLRDPDLCARRDMVVDCWWSTVEKVCTIYRDLGNLADLAECLRSLGGAREALEIYQLLGCDLLAVCSMCALAESSSISDSGKVGLYDKAIPIFDAVHYTFHFVECNLGLGHALSHLGKFHDTASILHATFPRLSYRGDLSCQCGMELIHCLIKTGQSGATIGASRNLLMYDSNERKCLPPPLRESLESLVCDGERGIMDENRCQELLTLTGPESEPDLESILERLGLEGGSITDEVSISGDPQYISMIMEMLQSGGDAGEDSSDEGEISPCLNKAHCVLKLNILDNGAEGPDGEALTEG
jgi:tetratricopeptide (TPR) repeat protein